MECHTNRNQDMPDLEDEEYVIIIYRDYKKYYVKEHRGGWLFTPYMRLTKDIEDAYIWDSKCWATRHENQIRAGHFRGICTPSACKKSMVGIFPEKWRNMPWDLIQKMEDEK